MENSLTLSSSLLWCGGLKRIEANGSETVKVIYGPKKLVSFNIPGILSFLLHSYFYSLQL